MKNTFCVFNFWLKIFDWHKLAFESNFRGNLDFDSSKLALSWSLAYKFNILLCWNLCGANLYNQNDGEWKTRIEGDRQPLAPPFCMGYITHS